MRDISEYIDFLSIDFVDEVVGKGVDGTPDKPKPFIGSIWYPSSQFPSGVATKQLSRIYYVGHMDMLLPSETAELNEDDNPSFTKLSFFLDGVERTFVQISGGDILDDADQSFYEFVMGLYPDANKPFSFNKSAVHMLSSVTLEGASCVLSGGIFTYDEVLSGVYTPDYNFHISVSGYTVLIQ